MKITDLLGSPDRGESAQRRARPLSPEEREKARDVRRLGSCIRCSILKASCDLGSPCQQCQKGRRLFIPCVRGQMEDLDLTIYGLPFRHLPDQAERPNTATALQELDLLATQQPLQDNESIRRYFIDASPSQEWARNTTRFIVATSQYLLGSTEYQELGGSLQKKLLRKVSELTHSRDQTLADWWALYNLTAVLLAAWQRILLFNISGTCLRPNFTDAVGVLVGVFEYHTSRMKNVALTLPEEAKSEAQKMGLPECLLEMEGYVGDHASDPFLSRLVIACKDFLQILTC